MLITMCSFPGEFPSVFGSSDIDKTKCKLLISSLEILREQYYKRTRKLAAQIKNCKSNSSFFKRWE